MEEEKSFLRDAFEVALKVMEEGKSIMEKGQLMIKVGAYLRTLVDIRLGRTTSESTNKQKAKVFAICSNFSQEEKENMKNIRKRKDGRYEFRMQRNNKKYDIVCKTLTELKNKVKNLRKSLQDNGLASMASKQQKFPYFASYWFETFKMPSIEEKTCKMYRDALKHLNALDMYIQDIKTSHLQEFLNKFPATRTKEILFMTIKQIFNKALELKVVKEDVSQFLVKGKIERTSREIINFDDQKKLLEYITNKNDKFSMALYVYLLTGCRPLEINQIRRKDIDDNLIFINGTKTKRAKRLVRISTKFSEMLKDFSKDLKPDEHLFNFSYDVLKGQFEKLRESLGIEGSIYCLRHTYSTNIYYLGATDKERQQSMGHSSSALTNDVYTHIDFKLNKRNLKNLYGDLYPDYSEK